MWHDVSHPLLWVQNVVVDLLARRPTAAYSYPMPVYLPNFTHPAVHVCSQLLPNQEEAGKQKPSFLWANCMPLCREMAWCWCFLFSCPEPSLYTHKHMQRTAYSLKIQYPRYRARSTLIKFTFCPSHPPQSHTQHKICFTRKRGTQQGITLQTYASFSSRKSKMHQTAQCPQACPSQGRESLPRPHCWEACYLPQNRSG